MGRINLVILLSYGCVYPNFKMDVCWLVNIVLCSVKSRLIPQLLCWFKEIIFIKCILSIKKKLFKYRQDR
jgi:hypothetical protein